jgi:hypothetical protein
MAKFIFFNGTEKVAAGSPSSPMFCPSYCVLNRPINSFLLFKTLSYHGSSIEADVVAGFIMSIDAAKTGNLHAITNSAFYRCIIFHHRSLAEGIRVLDLEVHRSRGARIQVDRLREGILEEGSPVVGHLVQVVQQSPVVERIRPVEESRQKRQDQDHQHQLRVQSIQLASCRDQQVD